MSKFVTVIPVDVHGVLELLPARAVPLDVRFDPEASVVEVEWDDDDFETGFTFPVEFARELLKAKKLPLQVKLRKGHVPGIGSVPAPGRRFAMTKAKPQELPGGPTTEVTRACPTPDGEPVDQDKGGRGKREG